MSALDDAKNVLNKVTTKTKKLGNKVSKFNKNNWFTIGGYALQTLSVVVPIAIITTLQDAWLKTGLGFGICAALFCLLIVFWRPIKKFNKTAPGVLPFAIIFLIALFFNMTMETIMIVAGSGLAGSVGATPLHMAYENSKKTETTPEVEALNKIATLLANKDEENTENV